LADGCLIDNDRLPGGGVLGAGEDGVFTIGEVRRTARAYRSEAEIFPRMGHDMMLDVGWQQVADRICAWVCGLPKS
jgi:hypothetical protein